MIKKIFILILNILIILGINTFSLYSQEDANKKESAKNQPIELPNFIIEGKEKINVPSSIKQYPGNPSPLSNKELDSINSLEKQASILLPPQAFPNSIINFNHKDGYLKAEIGRYTTPQIEASYGMRSLDYYLFGKANIETSSGHVDNAGYTKLNMNLLSEYTAPEKYWIFGGSLTRAGLNINTQSYKLYAQSKPEERTKSNLDLFINSDGNYGGYKFSTGANIKTLQLSGDSSSAFDNNLSAFVNIINATSNFNFGGGALLDFHSIRGNFVDFMQFNAIGNYIQNNTTIDFKAGIQTATGTDNKSRIGLYLDGNMICRIDKNYSLYIKLNSGLENNSYSRLINFNPYLIDTAGVEFAYNIVSLNAFLNYHPNEKISLSAGIKFRLTDREDVFVCADTGNFNVLSLDIKRFELVGEGSYKLTDNDILSGNITFIYSALSDNDNSVPFVSPINLSMDYNRKWNEKFGTKIGLTYVGTRYADILNKINIDGYFSLNLEADYNINKELTAFARIDNLLNSDVVIWNGYKERSLFVAAGVFWKF